MVMPDLFGGDPAPNSSSAAEESNASIIEKVKMRAAETAKSFLIDMWLARHTPEKVLPIIHRVLDGIKEEFADAVANGGGIYGVGYCFGGKYILLLSSEKPTTVAHGEKLADEEAGVVKAGPYLKAGAVAHGTLVTAEDFEGLKSPVSLVCVENDQLFPESVREAGEKYAKEHGVDCEFKTFSGVPHGFAVVGEYGDQHIQTAQGEAFTQMLEWIKAH